jgi:hypothetical protein
MIPVRIQAEIEQHGDEFVVTIPRVAMKHFGLRAGDDITFTPERIETALDRNPEFRAILEDILRDDRGALEYLAHDDATGERKRPS